MYSISSGCFFFFFQNPLLPQNPLIPSTLNSQTNPNFCTRHILNESFPKLTCCEILTIFYTSHFKFFESFHSTSENCFLVPFFFSITPCKYDKLISLFPVLNTLLILLSQNKFLSSFLQQGILFFFLLSIFY
jgi:hypothetical protein